MPNENLGQFIYAPTDWKQLFVTKKWCWYILTVTVMMSHSGLSIILCTLFHLFSITLNCLVWHITEGRMWLYCKQIAVTGISWCKTRACEQCHNEMRWERVCVWEWGWVGGWVSKCVYCCAKRRKLQSCNNVTEAVAAVANVSSRRNT